MRAAFRSDPLRPMLALGLACAMAVLPRTGASAPPHLVDWDDLDAAVAATHDEQGQFAMLCPPAHPGVTLFAGCWTFDPAGELAASLALFEPQERLRVPVWGFRSVEVPGDPRVWVYEGAGGNVFRTNAVPASFDPQAWVRTMYRPPPGWLSGAALEGWYADRDRSRLRLDFTLIASNDWADLHANLGTLATNPAAPRAAADPVLPADTNRLAFAGVAADPGFALRLWLYTPVHPVPVDVFARDSLLPANALWSLAGTVQATAPFEAWEQSATTPALFLRLARSDVDSDGDGIPDGRERLLFGTDPDNRDSDGDGLSDLEELYYYGTDAWRRDTDGDGLPDGWEVLNGLDPFDASDANADPDGDGLANRSEYLRGTNPWRYSVQVSTAVLPLRAATPSREVSP